MVFTDRHQVGAGPTGLVLALSLLKNGIKVRIINKAHTYHNASRGAGMQPRIQEIEHFLGTLSDVQAIGVPVPLMYNYDPENPYRVKTKVPFVEVCEPSPAFPIVRSRFFSNTWRKCSLALTILALKGSGLAVDQYLHEGILRKHVEAHGGKVELETELSSLSQERSSVKVQLSKIVDGKEAQEAAEFSYVVGADGGHSK